jgi:hypothetical protein
MSIYLYSRNLCYPRTHPRLCGSIFSVWSTKITY